MPAARTLAKVFRPRQKFPIVNKRGVPHYVKPNGKTVNAALSDAQKFGKKATKTKRTATRRRAGVKKAVQTRKTNKAQVEFDRINADIKAAQKAQASAQRLADKHQAELARLSKLGPGIRPSVRAQRAADVARVKRNLRRAISKIDGSGRKILQGSVEVVPSGRLLAKAGRLGRSVT